MPDHPDGMDAVFRQHVAAAAEAKAKVLATMRAKPYVVWTGRHLRECAGVANSEWGMYAILSLEEEGVLELDSHLRVRLLRAAGA